MSDFARPWCCPEPRCEPLWQVKENYYERLDVPRPGKSWACFGKMGEPVTFVYDGYEHENDLKSCSYTALKGVVSWQENRDDWVVMEDAYRNALLKLAAAVESEGEANG